MNIAYIAHWNLNQESGVLKKILTQMRIWIAAGHQAKLFALSPAGDFWPGIGDIQVERIVSPRFRTHLLRTRQLVQRVINWKPDLVYLRFSYYYPGMQELSQRLPVIAEINTDDVSESASGLDKKIYIYHLITRRHFLMSARAFVCVTHEIAERYAKFPGARLVSSNGIDLSRYAQLPAAQNLTPRLVFMGTPGQAWHGLDKIEWLARRRQDWQFDVIGPSVSITDRSNLPNLTYHGELNRQQYESILAPADVAIGTLALHRKEMNEACPIKVREYLAYGIPTLIGYQDTDFPTPRPFLLQIANTPDNVEKNLDKINGFVDAWKGKRLPPQEIAHLDVTAKEEIKLRFFSEIISNNATRMR
jgi:hypothetical protein